MEADAVLLFPIMLLLLMVEDVRGEKEAMGETIEEERAEEFVPSPTGIFLINLNNLNFLGCKYY